MVLYRLYIILSRVVDLYERLDDKARRRLLRILFKRIIIDTKGQILEVELNPPFEYLRTISDTLGSNGSQICMLMPGSNKKLRPHNLAQTF